MDNPDFSHLHLNTPTGAVAGLLAEQVAITGEVGNRILDFDPRTTGWDLTPDNVQVWDATKRLLPTIIVSDNGGVPPFFGPRAGEELELFIWVMAGPSRNNVRLVTSLSEVIRQVLRHRQVLGGPMLTWTFSIGTTATDSGYMSRHTFRLNGVFKRVVEED